jgi:putative ABC transport system permease protein
VAIRPHLRGDGRDRVGFARPGEIADGVTALGIVIALAMLVMSGGLIRAEAAQGLRTLTAAGASGTTRWMITAATA